MLKQTHHPLKQDLSKRKARLTTEVPPATMSRLKTLTTHLKASGYKVSMASLVERFLTEGMDRLQQQLGIEQVPADSSLKTLPPPSGD